MLAARGAMLGGQSLFLYSMLALGCMRLREKNRTKRWINLPFSSKRFCCPSLHFLIFSGSSLKTDLVGGGDGLSAIHKIFLT